MVTLRNGWSLPLLQQISPSSLNMQTRSFFGTWMRSLTIFSSDASDNVNEGSVPLTVGRTEEH